MKLSLLGDIHGDFKFYFDWLSQKEPNDIKIQLGDFGLGFNHLYDKEYQESIKKYPNARFLRGNHDNPLVCRNQPSYLGDFGMYEGIFFISGAWSIDWEWRTPFVNWWPDEELSYTELEECIKAYEKYLPDVVISHECADLIKDMVVMPIGVKPTRTGLAMNRMLEIHKPKHFIFAHYHVSADFNYLGTRFKCLNVKESFTMDL